MASKAPGRRKPFNVNSGLEVGGKMSAEIGFRVQGSGFKGLRFFFKMQWPFLRSDAGPVLPASLRPAQKQKIRYGVPKVFFF